MNLDTYASEADWQATVTDYARYRGWLVLHVPKIQDSGGRWRTATAYDGRGFPDLLLVRDRLVVAELKTEAGRLDPDQLVWQGRLRQAGVEHHVWRPSDWPNVERVLG